MNQTKKEIFSQYFSNQGAKKRILSLLLTVCMVITLVPNLAVPVSAVSIAREFGASWTGTAIGPRDSAVGSIAFRPDDGGSLSLSAYVNGTYQYSYCTSPSFTFWFENESYGTSTSWAANSLGRGNVVYTGDWGTYDPNITQVQTATITWTKNYGGGTVDLIWTINYVRGAGSFTHKWEIVNNTGAPLSNFDIYYGGHHQMGGGSRNGWTHFDPISNTISSWKDSTVGMYILRSDGAEEPVSYYAMDIDNTTMATTAKGRILFSGIPRGANSYRDSGTQFHTTNYMHWRNHSTIIQDGGVWTVEATEGAVAPGSVTIQSPVGRRAPANVVIPYEFTFRNMTTGNITLDISAAMDSLAAGNNWTAVIDGPTTFILSGISDTYTARINVTVPAAAADGSVGTLTVTGVTQEATPSTVVGSVTTTVDYTVPFITDVMPTQISRVDMDIRVDYANLSGTNSTLIRIYDSTGYTLLTQGTAAISSGAEVTGIPSNMLVPGETYTIRADVTGITYPYWTSFTMRGDEASGYAWKDFNGNGEMESFEGLYGIDMVLEEKRTSAQITPYEFKTTSASRGVVSFTRDTTNTQDHSHYPNGEYIVYPVLNPLQYAVEEIVAYAEGSSRPLATITSANNDPIFEYFEYTNYNGTLAISYKFRAGASTAITFYVKLAPSAVVRVHPHVGTNITPPTYVPGSTASITYTPQVGPVDTIAGVGNPPYEISFVANSNAVITVTAPQGYRMASNLGIAESRDKNNLNSYANVGFYDEYFRLIAGDLRLIGVSNPAIPSSAVAATQTANPLWVEATVTTDWAGVNAQLDFKVWNDQLAATVNPTNRSNYTWTLTSNTDNIISNFDQSTGMFTFTGSIGTAKVRVASSTGMYHDMEIKVVSATAPSFTEIYIANITDIYNPVTNIALTTAETREFVVVGIDGTNRARILNTLADIISNDTSIVTSLPTSGNAYNFTLTGISKGWTTIEASYGAHTATAYVLVTDTPVTNAMGIQISPNPVNLTSGGGSQTLTYTLTFQNAANNVVLSPEMVTPAVANSAIAAIGSDNETMNYISDGSTSVTASLKVRPSVTGTANVICSTGGTTVIPDGILTLQEATSPITGGFIEQGQTAEYFAFFDKNSNGICDSGETILPFGTSGSNFFSTNNHFGITANGATPENVDLTGSTATTGVDKLTVTYNYNGNIHTASTDIVVYSAGYIWQGLEVTPSPVVIEVGAANIFTVKAVFTNGTGLEKHILPATMYKGSVPTGAGYVSIVSGTQNEVKGITSGESVYRATLNVIPAGISGTGDANILVIPAGAKLKVTPNPIWIKKGQSETITYELVSSTGTPLTAPNLINYVSAIIANANVATIGSPITSITGVDVGRTTLTANLYGQAKQDITVYVWDDTFTGGNTGIEWNPSSLTINSGYTGISSVYLINTDGSRGSAVYLEHLTSLAAADTLVATIPASPSGTSLTVTGANVTANRNTKIMATSPAGNADLTVTVKTGVSVSGIKAEPAIIELWPGETKTVTVKNTGTGIPLDESQLNATISSFGNPGENDFVVVGSALELTQATSGVSSVNILTLTYDGKTTEVYIINYTENPYANGNVRNLTLQPNPVTMAVGTSEDVSAILTLTDSSGTVIDTLTLPAAVVTWSKNTTPNSLPGRIDIAPSSSQTISVTGSTAGAQTYNVTYSGGNLPLSAEGHAFVFAQSTSNIVDFYFEPDAVVLTPGDTQAIRGVIEYSGGAKQYISPQELPIAVPDLASDDAAIATVSSTGIIKAGNLNGASVLETFVDGTLVDVLLTGRTDVMVYDSNAQMRISPNPIIVYTSGGTPNTENIITWVGNYQVQNHFLEYSEANGHVSLTPNPSGDEYIVTGLTVGTDKITSLLKGTAKSATADVEVRDANATYSTVTYEANGGSGTMAPVTLADNTIHSVQPNAFTAPSGEYFAEWNTASDGTGTAYGVGNPLLITGHITLYAQWISNAPSSYTVTYDANDGSSATHSAAGTPGSTHTVLDENTFPAQIGKRFAKWSTDPIGTSGTDYMPNDPLALNSDITLYAIWEDEVTVTYDANGGSGTMSSYTGVVNDIYPVEQNTFTAPSGKQFVKWNTAHDGSGTSYVPGTGIVLASDITLYAIWEDLPSATYTVTYDDSGATTGTAPADSNNYSLNDNVTILGDNGMTKSGHTFAGWALNSPNGTIYQPGDTYTITGNATFYAVWISVLPANHTVTYNANGGTNTMASDSVADGASYAIKTNGFTPPNGKYFVKWIDETGASYYPGDSVIIDAPLSLYAVWDDIASPAYFTLTVTAGVGGRANTSASGSYQAGEVIDIIATANSNYTFANWTSTVGGAVTNTSRASTTVTMPASDVTVTANFTSSGGGLIIIPPIFFPTDNDDGGSKNPNTPPERPAKDTPAAADKTYTVTYKANEGIGEDYKVSGILSGAKHTVLDVVTTKISYPDHVFTGWNTKADGTGTGYAPGEKLTVTGDITLYAQWRVRVLLETGKHILYLNGYGDGTVKADNPITRAEAASIFYRLLKTQGEAAEAMFTDVDSSKWYAKAVNYLASMGILTGYADGTFKPDAPITRAEFATIATRFDTLVSFDGENTFKDVPDTHWAFKYINAGVAKGWINGYGDGTFKPDESITRAQVVKIVNAMLERKIDDASLARVTNPYTDISKDHWAYAEIIEASVPHEYIRDEDGNEIWEY